MNTPKFNNDMELNIYCELLSLAYKVYKEQSGGFVCGSKAEEIRDKMYQAIKEANIL
jgi:hypothetical protein